MGVGFPEATQRTVNDRPTAELRSSDISVIRGGAKAIEINQYYFNPLSAVGHYTVNENLTFYRDPKAGTEEGRDPCSLV